MVIGYLVVLNLFLALLLSSFGASNLSAPTSDSADTKKLQEAFDRFSRANKWVRNKIIKFFKLIKSKTRNQIADKIQRHNRSDELENKSRKNVCVPFFILLLFKRRFNTQLKTVNYRSHINFLLLTQSVYLIVHTHI